MGSILLPMVYVGMHLSWKINFQCLQLYIAGIKPAIDVGFSSIGLVVINFAVLHWIGITALYSVVKALHFIKP